MATIRVEVTFKIYIYSAIAIIKKNIKKKLCRLTFFTLGFSPQKITGTFSRVNYKEGVELTMTFTS